MRNFILFIYLFLTIILQAYSQAPAIEWQKTYGGSEYDGASVIIRTSDGGYIIAGSSRSNDGDINDHHGTNNDDVWVVKISSVGTIQWKKSYGSGFNYYTFGDYAKSIIQTADGGYIIAASSGSNGGDVTGHHGEYNYDYWIVKINSIGDIQWQKSLGGSNDDNVSSIIQTNDGGYLVVGNSQSNDGDVTGHHGEDVITDSWIVKLNSAGNILWQKSLGGSGSDFVNSVIQTSDGSLILAGRTGSLDGDVSGQNGLDNFWILKLNSSGNILWQKSLGGTSYEWASSIIQSNDGGYTLVGGSLNGNQDLQVVKLNSEGNIIWQTALGGTNNENGNSIIQTIDEGYIIAGYSQSNDGDVSGHHGTYWEDCWIVKLNSNGSLLWQKSIGGIDRDFAFSIIQSYDNGYILAGSSDSNDGDVTGNHGNFDFWVVKLACETPTPPTSATANPTNINTGQTSTLTASGCASGNTYLWKKGEATVATTASFTTPPLGTTTIYTAYCVNGSCVSSGSNVTVNVTQIPFSISPNNQLAICQTNTTITAVGCAGTVNWYRDTNGAGTTYVSLGVSNPLTYLINSDLIQYIRATCTTGLVTSDYSNYAIIRTGPNVTPQSYIVKSGGSKTLTASGCPVGTTYLWETGETTATVTKSPTAPPSQYPTVYNVKCVSPSCQSSNGFAYIYVGSIIANDDNYSVNTETPLTGNICSNDTPIVSKTIQIDPYPTHGNLVFDNSGAFTYTPNTGYTGNDFFEYYLLNGNELSNYARVTFNIVCPTSLSLQSPNGDDISSGIQIRKASYLGTITATNKITGTSNVTYQAKNIQLNAGFKADNGTVFKAEIGGCN